MPGIQELGGTHSLSLYISSCNQVIPINGVPNDAEIFLELIGIKFVLYFD